jgi:hypothetical protein
MAWPSCLARCTFVVVVVVVIVVDVDVVVIVVMVVVVAVRVVEKHVELRHGPLRAALPPSMQCKPGFHTMPAPSVTMDVHAGSCR